MSSHTDRAHVLAAVNRRIIETFSRRTIDALRAIVPVRLALPDITFESDYED